MSDEEPPKLRYYCFWTNEKGEPGRAEFGSEALACALFTNAQTAPDHFAGLQIIRGERLEFSPGTDVLWQVKVRPKPKGE
jgi:hypothetical protein